MKSVKQEMAVEIPKHLITQLQISLRKQLNVPSYDPSDSSLSTLPSLPHSISDSPRLRCLHCKAHLLRGPGSLLCIFCGKHQTNMRPSPIKFKSTSGYRWFLHSLYLDGSSEIVGESLEGNGSNRGPREEFQLSDLLDLEIRWNDAERQKFESGLRMTNPLNLAGLDLGDDFLAERKGESVSVPSQVTLTVNKETDSAGSKAFESRENLSLFDNFQGSKRSGSVSGWQADFQSADTKTDQNAISSRSFDPFVGSSKGISSRMGTVFGQGKNLFDGKENANQTSSESKTDDCFQDDIKSNSASGDLAQIIARNASGKKTTNDGDDSFDAWNDFKGSTSAQDAAHTSWDRTVNG
ncbi:uncharacterized protein LOC111314559 isoform X1 [Durio zibethinus]|uniref:Uncharacterized protein LOC111314559 isoform X1 n=1 Tax=Durio zibethinus TaxID=66656 RepID=A0A6P6B3N1_DURZI|nr:uncharacterized protein LOC111314559 isoform X1 [Durio zibethinus]